MRPASLSVAILGVTLVSSVLITADSNSVYSGESLFQVLLILLSGLAMSFAKPSDSPCRDTVSSDSLHWVCRVLTALIIVWMLISTSAATMYADGRAAWNGFWHVTALLLLGWQLRNLCHIPGFAKATSRVLVMCGVVLSVYALHQVFVTFPETRAAYERNPDAVLAQLSIDAPPGSSLRAGYESRLYSSEPTATFALTNSLAVVLSGAIVFVTVLMFEIARQRTASRKVLIALLAMDALLIWPWLLTKSRTAYLSVLAVFAILGVMWLIKRRTNSLDKSLLPEKIGIQVPLLFVILGLGIFVGGITLLSSDTLIISEAPKSLLYRLEYWQASSRMILDHWLTGVGLGNFQSYYPRYKLPTASETIADPHNWMFDIAATSSTIVLAAVVMILAVLMRRSFSLYGRSLTKGHASLPDENHKTHAIKDAERQDTTTVGSRSLVRSLIIGVVIGGCLLTLFLYLLKSGIDEAGLRSLMWATISVAIFWAGTRTAWNVSDVTIHNAALGAALTMIVCLLSSGSWQASGIAIPLFGWLACLSGLARRIGNEVHPDKSEAAPQSLLTSDTNRTQLSYLPIGIWSCVLIAFLFQTWRPVQMSWVQQQMALSALTHDDATAAIAAARSACEADSMSPNAKRFLAQMLCDYAQASSEEDWPKASAETMDAIDQLLSCDPAASMNWQFASQSALTLAASSYVRHGQSTTDKAQHTAPNFDQETRQLLNKAVDYQSQAVVLDPTGVAVHAQLAVLYALVGDQDEMEEQIDEAYELSSIIPHWDKQLPMQQVWLPGAFKVFPDAAIVRPVAGASWVKAEPLIEFLRSTP